MIDENVVDWRQEEKFLPIKVMFKDFVPNCRDENFFKRFSETPLISLTYNNNYTIWEALIRRALAKGTIAINDKQLTRIMNPVMLDKNQNLLHHLVTKLKVLKLALGHPKLIDLYNKKNKRFPFFKNFEGKS